jgi:hypothetical protein
LGLGDRIVDYLLKKYNMINLEDKKVKSFQEEYQESINMRLFNTFKCDELNNEILTVRVKPPMIKAFNLRMRPQKIQRRSL